MTMLSPAEIDKMARGVVILAIARVWVDFRGTAAELPLLNELAIRVREYEAAAAIVEAQARTAPGAQA